MNKTKIIAIVSLSVILALGAGAYFFTNDKTDVDNQISNATRKDINVSEEDKQLPLNPEPSGQTDGSTEYDDNDKKILIPDDVPDDGNLPETPRITRAEYANDKIRIAAIFSNASSGRCILNLTREGQQTITRNVPVVIGPSYYSCNGFSINRSDIPTSGAWQASIIHSLNGKNVTSEKVIIEVK